MGRYFRLTLCYTEKAGTVLTKHFHKRFLRTAALFLTVCMLLSSFSASPMVFAEESIEDLNSQKNDLEVRQEELAAQRDDAADTLEEQQAQSNIIRQQIDAKSEEIAIHEQILSELDSKIAATEAEIAEKESSIKTLEEDIQTRYQTLRTRLRAISKKSILSSFIQFILGNSTYTDYLIGFKMSQRISAHDQAVMDQLEMDIAAVDVTKNKLKTDKAALEIERNQADAVRTEMEAAKASLQQLYNESDALAQEMAQNVAWLDEQIVQMEQEQQAIQNEIDSLLEKIRAEEEEARKEAEENGEEYIPDDDLSFTGDGTMTWPTPTCRVITSSFKLRQLPGQPPKWHKGLDIACYGDAEGEPIVAAADGVVSIANDYDSYGGGLGYYMMIDHGYDGNGRRVITVYAHCSRVDVYEGQTVTAGQQIGLVGDTGYSFGAHLHFQINLDDEAVDPISNGYLTTDGIDVLG